jgi:hypothetical protein
MVLETAKEEVDGQHMDDVNLQTLRGLVQRNEKAGEAAG